MDPEDPDGGPVTELVTEVLQRAGYQPEVQYKSWSLVEESVTDGTSAAAFPLVVSQERSEKFVSSESLVDFEYVLFYDTAKGAPEISSADDLAKLRVGGIAGYDYWSEIDAAVDNWIEFDTSLEGFNALKDGRIDLLAEGLIPGQALVAGSEFHGDAAGIDYIRDVSPLVRSKQGVHLMVSRTNESETLIAAFNKALADFRRTEEYNAVLDGLAAPSQSPVRLEPYTESGLVELLDATGRQVLLAPRGTEAEVLTWPDELTTTAEQGSKPPLVEIKVTAGPAAGRVVFVDARSIVVGSEAE
ncbi:hypothetical protein GCM10009751_04740 [Myceligenerans crystallogenes]|uniref:Solute-binding protein family 3/N-terminal domain-containing protein n=1 Tax=Myceligenerans crystallogenes TaxID=316335 RepID=A0ABN2N3Z8_9MICO